MKKAISAVVIIGLIVLLFNLSEKNKKDKNISDFSNNSNSNSKDLLENEKLEDVIEYNDKDKEKKEVSLEDFDIRYIHVPVQNRDFVLVTNKSKITSTLKINSVVKDINGKMLSIDEKYISPVGSGETVIGSLSCSKNDEQDTVEHEIIISKNYYKSAVTNLTYEPTVNSGNIILSITNNGDYLVQYVKAYILFFDESNTCIDSSVGFVKIGWAGYKTWRNSSKTT